MKTYDEKHIKNIALVGASKSGMTTLAEAMHFEAGQISRLGTIEAGSTVSDYHEVEKEKGISVYTTPLHLDWRHYKINILDAPGVDDFLGEALKAIRMADTAVLMINAQNGVEVTTEVLWSYIDNMRKPTVLGVNQLDHPQASWSETLSSMKEHFGARMLPLQFPVQTGNDFHEIVDALRMKMYRFGPEGGKPEKLPIPEEYLAQAEEMHKNIVEAAATNKEELLEHYLDQGSLTEDELREGLKIGMLNHEIFPVFCLSAKNDMGSGRLMGFIDNVAPSPVDLPSFDRLDGPATIFIYKTGFEPNLGKVSYFKVISGTLNAGDRLRNISLEGNVQETIGQLYLMDGKNRTPVNKLQAGDLGAALKMKEAHHDQTLSANGITEPLPPTYYPEDRIVKAVNAVNQADQEKIVAALKKLEEQDPSFRYSFDSEQHQMLIGCQGEIQLEVNKWILENEFNLEVEFSAPKIAYRESITRPAIGFYRHKKQSGGSGQFAEVKMKIEPWTENMKDPEGYSIRSRDKVELPWGGTLEVISAIVGGVIDSRFIPSIQKGILEAMAHGPIDNYPIRDVRVIIFDGKMHPVDSNDMAFKMAGNHAFKEAVKDAKPILLEPVMEVTLTVPEFALGGAMTEVQSRRGIVIGMDLEGKNHKLISHIPKAETVGLSTQLRSLAHGQAGYKTRFLDLRPAPSS
ncbi:MAG: elongation factor G [Bacteroidia bacterium]